MTTELGPTRCKLALRPTPLELARRASAELGIELWIKRDDLTGSTLSGNKIRKLEVLLADAERLGADVVLTCGGAQSNHARATAIAARQLGMDAVLFLRGAATAHLSGNLLLDRLVGAEIRAITPEEYRQRDALMAEAAATLKASGRRPYVIPEGGSNALGSYGYYAAAQELRAQTEERGFAPDWLITAVGSGGTFAGLAAAVARREIGGRLLGFAVCDDRATFRARAESILAEMGSRFDWSIEGLPASCDIEDGYVGRGYGLNRPDELETLRWIASTEGLILDPVYTGKALHGLVAEVRRGRIAAGSRVVFWHTGGIFGLFRGDEAEQVAGAPG
ncbi:MAG: D-cysteine desulfhydrase family protein [Myxococcales bacterium]|nr:D-cysteine desulfhydrase family protein [Myxococcales bacterium]